MDRSFPLQIDKKLQSEKIEKIFRLNILVKFFNCSSAQCMKNDDKCLIWIFILFKVIIFPRQKIALDFEFWRQNLKSTSSLLGLLAVVKWDVFTDFQTLCYRSDNDLYD